MGIVVEYADQTGKPQWVAPPVFKWNYTLFADPKPTASRPDDIIEMTFAKHNAAERGFNRWTINDVSFSMEKMEPMFKLTRGKRYRWRMRNASDDIHPMHMHRHSFELTKIAGRPTSGLIKDVVMLGGYQELEVDFTADQPGLTLFHCHMQLHGRILVSRGWSERRLMSTDSQWEFGVWRMGPSHQCGICRAIAPAESCLGKRLGRPSSVMLANRILQRGLVALMFLAKQREHELPDIVFKLFDNPDP